MTREVTDLDFRPLEREPSGDEEGPVYNPAVAIQYETEAPLAPRSTPGPYRAADYLALPDDPRCELLFGSLVVTPAPTTRHQAVAARLARLLFACADLRGDIALFAPLDVVLADHSVVQPDLVYIRAARAEIVHDRIEGAPDLVVEILSPATARNDLGEKLRLYAEAGVAEYWIVDPEVRTLELLTLRDGAYLVLLPERGVYRSATIDGLVVDVATFWTSIRP
jgi:Uma2 family endonuclease